MRYAMRYLWDHYHLPMVITENGFGAHESVGEDGRVHDQYRIDFLRDTIYQLGLAIEDGSVIVMLLAVALSFGATWFLYKEDKK